MVEDVFLPNLAGAMQREHDFDVFLSHAHADAGVVEELAIKLELAQQRVWLDRWVLVPGERWIQHISRALNEAKTCAVCVGSRTPRGWFQEEVERALNRQASDPSFRVIPVMLPGCRPEIVDDFLQLRTWIDFSTSSDDDYSYKLLLSGIQGIPPPRRLLVEPTIGTQDNELRDQLRTLRSLREEGLLDHEVVQDFQKQLVSEILLRAKQL